MKKNIIYKTLIVLVGVLFFYSCSNSEDLMSAPRLFRPVLSAPLTATDNSIKVSMAALKNVAYYIVEVSKDNFVTIKTYKSTEPIFVIKDLIWNKEYQVRATAISANPETEDSGVALLGKVKTDRFPSILAIPSPDDIIDIGLNVRWTTGVGLPVTDVKFFNPLDEEFLTPLFSYPTTANQQATGLKAIKTLKPVTQYTVAIYSGATLRGYEVFTTKAALPVEGNILDLRGDNDFDPATDDGSYLKTKLDIAQTQPTTVILDGDQTYKLNGYNLTNSIKLLSGYSLTSGGAVINVINNFNTAVGTTAIASIVFDGVKFKGQGIGSNYLFAPTNDKVTITDFVIKNCAVSDFRGMFRLRGANGGEITNFVMDNVDLSQIGGYMVLNTDNAAWDWKNATFKNCTIHQVERFVQNKHAGSVFNLTITDCTFFEIAKGGNNAFIYTGGGSVLANLKISNTIFGHGWDSTNTSYAYLFMSDALAIQISTFNNVYDTADSSYTLGKAPSDLGTFIRYSGSSNQLFIDPANGNFTYLDKTFAGKSSVGALRWRL